MSHRIDRTDYCQSPNGRHSDNSTSRWAGQRFHNRPAEPGIALHHRADGAHHGLFDFIFEHIARHAGRRYLCVIMPMNLNR